MALTEEDTKVSYIYPALAKSGWKNPLNYRTEVKITDGQILIKDNIVHKSKPKFADIVLYYKRTPIAVIEAKKYSLLAMEGYNQAKEYSQKLKTPFAFASNGKEFIEINVIDGTTKSIKMDDFPTPEELFNKYKTEYDITEEVDNIINSQFYFDTLKRKTPRYYQTIAVNKVCEAVVRGQKRILLVSATGTGKTFIASQIVYKLREAQKAKRILFLTDRNLLADQPMNNDFAFLKDKGIVKKITSDKIDTSYEIYFSLYHQLINENHKERYKEFGKDFFDLIIIDECHRGSRKLDSEWREIIDYFESATQIGLTATPINEEDGSNYDFFGEPVYQYSLKQGIEDGFLAPYNVIRVNFNVDTYGIHLPEGYLDEYGNPVEGDFGINDYDREIVIKNRHKAIAKYIKEYMKNDPYGKTIVFCVDESHALLMKQAIIDENPEYNIESHNKYCVRITSRDDEGKLLLDDFTDYDKKFPAIATTSKLLSTGVDVPTCKLIVLDKNIGSMAEFKQTIGRGTRLRRDKDKLYFTIIDFRGATVKFDDPEFDGEPISVTETKGLGGTGDGEEIPEPPITPIDPDETPRKYYIHKYVKLDKEIIRILDEKGRLIQEDFIDWTKGNINKEFKSLKDFINNWSEKDKRDVIIKEMEDKGIWLEELKKIYPNMDILDIICNIGYGVPPKSRKERGEEAKKKLVYDKYTLKAREIIDKIIDKYIENGIEDIRKTNFLRLEDFNIYGTPVQIAQEFGGINLYNQALTEIENALYN